MLCFPIRVNNLVTENPYIQDMTSLAPKPDASKNIGSVPGQPRCIYVRCVNSPAVRSTMSNLQPEASSKFNRSEVDKNSRYF